jgi:hypothetical protein
MEPRRDDRQRSRTLQDPTFCGQIASLPLAPLGASSGNARKDFHQAATRALCLSASPNSIFKPRQNINRNWNRMSRAYDSLQPADPSGVGRQDTKFEGFPFLSRLTKFVG